MAPSPIPFSPTYPLPKELDTEGIERIKKAFGEAVGRWGEVGGDFVEVHGAHVSEFQCCSELGRIVVVVVVGYGGWTGRGVVVIVLWWGGVRWGEEGEEGRK